MVAIAAPALQLLTGVRESEEDLAVRHSSPYSQARFIPQGWICSLYSRFRCELNPLHHVHEPGEIQ
jgi:hypothetical protein